MITLRMTIMKRYLRGIHSSTVLTLPRIRNRILNQVNEKVSDVNDTTATTADKKTSSESKSTVDDPSRTTTPTDEPYKRFPGNPFDFSAFAGSSLDDLSLYPQILKSFSKDEMKLMKEGMDRIRQVPSLKPVVQDLETNGQEAMKRYWNDEDVINKVIDASGIFQVNADGFVHAAARNGLIESLKKAIASGVDVNEKDSEGMTALHYACAKGHVLM
ncbi:uncharacterized protein [Rutidosis leptorrhynchoides]|uniref:uncharacterized protein n=1 Tax=Rutidosis leptorrhynchoides TaxID=125765 RepID=UPI003A996DA4